MARVVILYLDYVELSKKFQKPFQDSLAEIYREAGVELEWIPCPIKEGTLAFFPNCWGFKESTHLVLQMPAAAPKGMKTDAKGETPLGPRIVNIWDRVQSEAIRFNVPVPDLLAHVIGHEIGHLLLGPNSRSSSGIMMGKWRLWVWTTSPVWQLASHRNNAYVFR